MPAPPPESEPAMVSAICMDARCATRKRGASLRSGCSTLARGLPLRGNGRGRQRREALLERVEVRRIVRQRGEDRRVDLGDLGASATDAVLLERVRREPGIDAARRAIALLEQDLEHLRNAIRMDAGPHDVL